MARVKIRDLPKDAKINKEEMRVLLGSGIDPIPFVPSPFLKDKVRYEPGKSLAQILPWFIHG